MIDYSVRYRCQGTRADGKHCTRRGRRTRWAPLYWLCWQHVRMFPDWKRTTDIQTLLFRSELLP